MKGHGYRPHLVKAYRQGTQQIDHKIIEEYPIKLKNTQAWDVVFRAMEGVITHLHGTGFRFGRKAPYRVAAKTGTAQVYSIKQNQFETQDDLPEYLRDHSLIIAFAPVDKPKIAVAVVIENNNIASNVARKVIDHYLLEHANDKSN